MSERPILSMGVKSSDFKEFYYLKEELVDFCRSEGLKTSGNKKELTERISYYLDTGCEKESLGVSRRKVAKVGKIAIDDIIGENFRCSEVHREFFKSEIGEGFSFKVAFQKWLKDNGDKTFKEAIGAYYEILAIDGKSEIGGQFEYNQYIRDFFEDNDGLVLEDAIKCWKYKKSLKGGNKYDKNDLFILNNFI